MVELVTKDQVKAALKLDGNEDDIALDLLIPAASGAILNYLKSSGESIISPSTAPHEVQIATIYLIGVLMRNPDNDTERAFDRGYLPMPVTAMLYPLRDPALA
ncbi:head-tail connector protein [Paracoccus sp. DMF-8]|uniref:head-tail connector protein n=1 Tax=Paracoccus sp. DMF-8 TaxID=3019445 RepID=UPI0023E7FD49|nr:head-tail connector protein [Paracoccus sp. DMF-8]MDF3606327.1 head-tail connector protein [Paracoccus sp. DMF-8]